MGLKGKVSSLPDHKGNLFVQCGSMRSQANVRDLVPADGEPEEQQPFLRRTPGGSHKTGNIKLAKSYQVSPEINLLGKTVDEAVSELDKYLDDAYLAHLSSVRIVHGKGTGALRRAVQAHLKKTGYVESYRQGEYGEGDSGVTIAVFRS